MRLSISHLAWQQSEEALAAELLQHYAIDAVDLAPARYFPHPPTATESEISRVRRWWQDRGIEIFGLQALLFGSEGLNLFAAAETQQRMLDWLESVCRIATGLGAKRLVFGSPKNRDRGQLSCAQALQVALDFFQRLALIAQHYGVIITLEANPPCYGANFLTHSAQVEQFVRELDHPALRMQLDTGTIALNQEDPALVITAAADIIGHVHLSEPHLVPLGEGGVQHSECAAICRRYLAQHVLTIEVKCTLTEKPLETARKSLALALKHYQ